MANQPLDDPQAILAALESLRAEVRVLASEVAGLAAEVMNIRRQLPDQIRRY